MLRRRRIRHSLLTLVAGCFMLAQGCSTAVALQEPDAGPTEDVETVQGCQSNDDCLAVLAPIAPCDVGICDVASGTCSRQTAETGAVCEDGNVCTTNDTCFGGTCLGGAPLDCDDGEQCTDDTCDTTTGCLNTAREGSCNDGDECTVGEVCADGACLAGEPVDCDDDNPCSIDGCNSEAGCVWTVRLGEACDDGDECTAGDVCSTGSLCVASAELDCDDGNACTDDSCDTFSGCLNLYNTDECDDLDPCTFNDACDEGVCVGVPNPCDDGSECTLDSCDPVEGCQNQPHFGPCDDDSLCTINDTCATGTCVGEPNGCDEGNPCTVDYCHPIDGCQHTILEGASCEDGNPCSTLDSCDEFGVCLPGTPTPCDDFNECTHDSCSTSDGCVNVPTTAECDDDNACTQDDVCTNGTCLGVDAVCDDENPCTFNQCSFITGCVFPYNNDPCDDLDDCTTDDVCDGGACNGTLVDCDDSKPCTVDTCLNGGECEHTIEPGPCEDGNPCTSGDVCADGECLAGTPTDCDDGDECTLDACTYESGCMHVLSPACTIPTGWLVINEFDYEQSGDDAADFVELIVIGDQTVELDRYRLELVDGATGAPYAVYQLIDAIEQLHPGEMLILGPPAIVNPLAGIAATQLTSGNFLQNGGSNGDAIRVVRTLAGVEKIMDAVSYEAPVFLANEGDTHVGWDGEFAEEAVSFLRCPDGIDTDDNALDFIMGPPSPGVTNDCQ